MFKKNENTISIGFSSIICLLAYQIYVYLASPQVPFMDTMRILIQLEGVLNGELSWMEIYGSGEHRGLIYQFITLVEWIFWRVDARITTVLTGFIVTLTFYIFIKAFLAGIEDKNGKKGIFFILIIFSFPLIFSSPAGFELWTLDLGFSQLIKNLFIVVFLYSITINRSWNNSLFHSLTTGSIGAFLILFCTYGWSYPFYAASIFGILLTCFCAPHKKYRAATIILMLSAAQIMYVASGNGVFSNNDSIASTSFSFVSLVKAMLYGASTVLIGSELIGKLSIPTPLLFFLGLVLLTVAALTIGITLIQKKPSQIFFSSLIIFSVAVLVGVSLARGMNDFTNVGAPRYFVDFIWILFSPLAIAFHFKFSEESTTKNLINFRSLALLHKMTLCLLIAAIIGHSITWSIEIKLAPNRKAIFENMSAIFERGVTNADDAIVLQSPYLEAKRAVEIIQEYKLSNVRNKKSRCSLKSVQYLDGSYEPEINGARWLSKQATIIVNGCKRNIEIKGFVPNNFSERRLNVGHKGKTQLIDILPGQVFVLRLKNITPEQETIFFSLDRTTNPSHSLDSIDNRDLGFLIIELKSF